MVEQPPKTSESRTGQDDFALLLKWVEAGTRNRALATLADPEWTTWEGPSLAESYIMQVTLVHTLGTQLADLIKRQQGTDAAVRWIRDYLDAHLVEVTVPQYAWKKNRLTGYSTHEVDQLLASLSKLEAHLELMYSDLRGRIDSLVEK